MALVFEGSRCAICQQLLGDRPYTATSGVAFEADHPLYPYCDAPLHWDCYTSWSSRLEFARAYFEQAVHGETINPYWARVYEDDDVFVSVNPDPSVGEVSLCFAATGMGLRVLLASWSSWLKESERNDLQPLQEQSLSEVIARVARCLPTSEAILSRVDRTRQAGKADALERERERQKSDRRARIQANHLACRKVAAQLRRGGFVCPHCSAKTSTAKYHKNYPESESYFVCDQCGRSHTRK